MLIANHLIFHRTFWPTFRLPFVYSLLSTQCVPHPVTSQSISFSYSPHFTRSCSHFVYNFFFSFSVFLCVFFFSSAVPMTWTWLLPTISRRLAIQYVNTHFFVVVVVVDKNTFSINHADQTKIIIDKNKNTLQFSLAP